MFLLQLPTWSYVVLGASVLALIAAVPVTAMTRRFRRNEHVLQRRARAAAHLLRILHDEQVRRAMGISAR